MIAPTLYSSRTDEWETPQDVFDALDAEFHFTLDPACTDDNAKCAKHYTKEQDGLKQSWDGETVFLNPPYGRDIAKWMQKAYGVRGTVVALIPARVDTAWFHDWVYGKAEIRFIRGRLKYGGAKNNSPFPSMIVIYRGGNRNDP